MAEAIERAVSKVVPMFAKELTPQADGDAASRASFYATLRNSGVITANEIRAKENMNPVEGGDEFPEPVNPFAAQSPQGEDAPDDEAEPDDDEEDDKSLAKKFGQGVASTLTTLVLGRDYGNISRTMINYGVEKANEEYLDFLREGEYDAYEDAIQYNFLSSKDGKALEGLDILASVTGPMGPSIKTLGMALKATGPDKKEAAASERQQRERWQRLPLEVFGNLGYIPLYKDIRNILNKDIYKDVRKELGKTEEKEEFKPMGLGREDLKRYYPEIYEQYYGEGTEYSAKRKLKSEQDRLEREIKDEYYNYTPKKKQSDGFGGKGFGTGTGKKSGGFGSKGFGK
jgi:hypothetical protein